MAVSGQVIGQHSIEDSLQLLLALTHHGANNEALQIRLQRLEGKLAKGQLYLAVLGQMKRGKSSFINALLGAEVLPTGVLPVTAIITEIKYGPLPNASVVFANGDMRVDVAIDALAKYVTEAGNPGNQKQVASVEISYPSMFLESGVVLIDTPGIGSTHRHNTQTTEDYMSHVDAGIIVLSVDPPITEVESQFVKRIKDEVPRLFFILNKTDIASAQETSKIVRFLDEELRRLQIAQPEIYPLSTRQALLGKQQGRGGAAPGGLESFETRLHSFLLHERKEVLVRSIALDVLQIARTLKFGATIGSRASAMSTEELERTRLAMEELIERSQIEMRELDILLRQQSSDILSRVEGDLNAQVETSIPKVQEHLSAFEAHQTYESGRAFGSALEKFLMNEIEGVFRAWRIQEDEMLQLQLDAMASRFVMQANGIVDRLERSAGELFEIPLEGLSIFCPLKVESRLHYRVERIFYSLDSMLLLLPRFLMRPIVLRRIRANVPVLLDMNAGRIRYDYLDRLQQSIARFQSDLRGSLAFIIDNLRSALSGPSAQKEDSVETCRVLNSVIDNCSILLEA